MLGLAHIQQRRHPALLAGLRQSEEDRPGGQGLPRDLHLQIQLTQREVGTGHVADQGQHHGPAEILRGQQIGPGRLGGAPEAAPQVQLPRQAGPALGKEGLVVGCLVSPRLPIVGGGHGEIGGGELERPRDHDLGFQHGKARLPHTEPLQLVHRFLVVGPGCFQNSSRGLDQPLGPIPIPGNPVQFHGGGRTRLEQSGDALVLLLQSGQAASLRFELSGRLLETALKSLDFQRQPTPRLLDAHLLTLQFLGRRLQFGQRAIQRRLQVPIFESEQDFPFENALAPDNVDAFDAAFDAAPYPGDGASDGRLAQNEVLVSVGPPGYGDGHSRDGCQADQPNDAQTRDPSGGPPRVGRGLIWGGRFNGRVAHA